MSNTLVVEQRYTKAMSDLMEWSLSAEAKAGTPALRRLCEIAWCWKAALVGQQFGFAPNRATGEEGLYGHQAGAQGLMDEMENWVRSDKIFAKIFASGRKRMGRGPDESW